MLEMIIPTIDFWVWSLVPTIMLLAILMGLPAALLVGALIAGKTPVRQASEQTASVNCSQS